MGNVDSLLAKLQHSLLLPHGARSPPHPWSQSPQLITSTDYRNRNLGESLGSNYIEQEEQLRDEEIRTDYANMADVYFNGRVNYTTVDQMIMGYILSGFTMASLRLALSKQSVLGLNPKLTVGALRKFESNHGRSPDVVQMANYDHQPHQGTYEKEAKEDLTFVGEVVSTDNMFSDFNETRSNDGMENLSKKVRKLKTHGGGSFATLAVDHYSGYYTGRICKDEVTSVEIIKELIDVYETCEHPIKTLIADEGLVSESSFKVFTPAVQTLLLDKHIKFQKVMPGGRNHSNGGNIIEPAIRYMKRKMRLAFNCAMSNEAIFTIGFTEMEILRFWGDIFYWALLANNLGRSFCDPTKTKYEVRV